MTSGFRRRALKRWQEPELFAPPPRGERYESHRIYDAVVFLRKHGFRVSRISNRQNNIDGDMCSHQQMFELVAALKRKEEAKKNGAKSNPSVAT